MNTGHDDIELGEESLSKSKFAAGKDVNFGACQESEVNLSVSNCLLRAAMATSCLRIDLVPGRWPGRMISNGQSWPSMTAEFLHVMAISSSVARPSLQVE